MFMLFTEVRITAAKKNRATIILEKSPTFPSGKPLYAIPRSANPKKKVAYLNVLRVVNFDFKKSVFVSGFVINKSFDPNSVLTGVDNLDVVEN